MSLYKKHTSLFLILMGLQLTHCARQDIHKASVIINPIAAPVRDGLGTKKQKSLAAATMLVHAKKGDTIYKIAKRHMIPLKTLIEDNNLKPPFDLKPHQLLSINRPRVHIAAYGETLSQVAKLHRVDVFTLTSLNDLKAPYTIKPGQALRLPAQVYDVYQPLPTLSPLEKRQQVPSTRQGRTLKITEATLPRNAFIAPLQGKIISEFGPQDHGLQNDGINVEAPAGTPIKSVDDGVVMYVGQDIPSFGNLIIVKHSHDWASAYAHGDRVQVKRGQKVFKGATLAKVGKTGHVASPQLHFELRRGRSIVNPKLYIKF